MNKITPYAILAFIEFAKGFLLALVGTKLVGLDVSTLQSLTVGALLPAMSIVLTGLDKARSAYASKITP